MARLCETHPFHFVDGAEEGLHYVVCCFVVLAVYKQGWSYDFGEEGEEGEIL